MMYYLERARSSLVLLLLLLFPVLLPLEFLLENSDRYNEMKTHTRVIS